MFSLYSQLARIIHSGDPESTDAHIAATLARRLERLHLMSIGEVAKACNVSKSTVSKFVRALGYEDYSEFKTAAYEYWMKERYSGEEPGTPDVNITDYVCRHGEAAYRDVLLRDIAGVFDDIPQADIDAVAAALHGSDDVMAFGHGYSGTAAENLRVKMAFYRKIVLTADTPRKQDEYIGRATRGSVIVVFSNSGQYLSMYQEDEILTKKTLFNACPATVILITANAAAVRDPRVDLGIVLPQSCPVRNHPILYQVVIERIAAAYQRAYGFPQGMIERDRVGA